MRVAEAETIIRVPTTTVNGTLHKALAHQTIAEADLKRVNTVGLSDHALVALRKAMRLTKAALAAAERI